MYNCSTFNPYFDLCIFVHIDQEVLRNYLYCTHKQSHACHLFPGDVGGQFTEAPPTCPSDVITFSCTVAGDNTSFTTWRVDGSSICSLPHNSRPGTTSTCGPDNVFTARFNTTNATSFSSILSGPASSALDGTLVECFGPAFSLDAGNRVGSNTIQTIG